MGMLKLGPVRQVAYVVKGIEKAMKDWADIGVGPWFYVEKVPVENYQYKGKPYDLDMSVALSNSGYIQIELIQQRNDAPSLYLDYPQKMGGGIHHVSHWLDSEEYDKKFQELLDLGYIIGHSGNIGVNGRFAYFINDKLPGTILEISEMSGFKGEYFKAIADMCMNWDGSDPIRR
mgnify:CR=1 FL=1